MKVMAEHSGSKRVQPNVASAAQMECEGIDTLIEMIRSKYMEGNRYLDDSFPIL